MEVGRRPEIKKWSTEVWSWKLDGNSSALWF